MPLSSQFGSVWSRVKHWPFVWVFVIAIALQFIGERFPFSPFPMYSGFSKETTVLYVTDAKDEPLAIKKVFRLDASKVKKAYNKALIAICKKNGRDDGDATPADVQAAGKYMVEFLPTQARGEAMEKKLREDGLRLYRISFEMTKAGISQSTELVGASR
ncbi:MAG: hypothetical protein ABIT76_12470 [Chthoniobacterales bacterium]